LAALLVGAALMAGKFYAYWLTQSAAILSDALESIINVVASGFALVSILIAAKSPDPSHPYGHGKIEYFSAGFEGALIILAAAGIFHQGWGQLFHPHPLPHLEGGVLIVAGVSLVNLALGLTLIQVGRRTQSLTLVADGKHLLTDVYTSAGVVGGLALVGLNILVTGLKLVRQGAAGLMDTSDPKLLEEVCNLLARHRKYIWIDIHRLRARRAGRRILLDFHLILPRDMTITESHQEVKELEGILTEYFQGQADVLIHVDPCEDPECPVCAHYPCELRREETSRQRLWRREVLVAPEE
jgi:cation diffusion facilitator family transporter